VRGKGKKMKWRVKKAREEGRIRQGEAHSWVEGGVTCFERRCFQFYVRHFPKIN
jgi:hypothetical protein